MMLPADCVALIIQEQWVEALALECVLGEIGCATVGPLAFATEVEQLLKEQQPNFALLDGKLGEHKLLPIANRLKVRGVPFALLSLGMAEDVWDEFALLRTAPRLDRFLHPPSLYATARSLYRVDASTRLGAADQRIKEGQQRLARQLRLIELLEIAGADVTQAEILAQQLARALKTMRTSRTILAEHLVAEDRSKSSR